MQEEHVLLNSESCYNVASVDGRDAASVDLALWMAQKYFRDPFHAILSWWTCHEAGQGREAIGPWCGQALSPCRVGVEGFTTRGGLHSLTPRPDPSALLACDAPPRVPYQFPLHLRYQNTLLKLPRPPSPAKYPNSYSHIHLVWAFLLIRPGRWVASNWEKDGDPLIMTTLS